MTPDQAFQAGLVLAGALSTLALLVHVGWSLRVRRRTDVRSLPLLGSDLAGHLDEADILRSSVYAGQRLFVPGRLEVTVYPHPGGAGALVGVGGRRGDEALTVQPPAGDSAAPGRSSSVLMERLIAHGEVIGHVTVRVPPRHRRRSKGLLEDFAATLAASLTAARNDQAQRREAVDRTHEADHDPLTGLGNRVLLERQGPAVLATSAANGDTAALVLFDLDGFKWVNDTLGHAFGDLVLTEVARRVRSTVRDTDLAIRLGGDEFAVLAPGMHSAEDAEELAERLVQALGTTLRIREVALETHASMGVAVRGRDAASMSALLEAADAAMYAAKRDGGGRWRRAVPAVGKAVASHQPLRVEDLRQAMAGDELVLHFQPQVAADTGEVVAFEALARWDHPELGTLQPLDFLPFVERQGLMPVLTLAVVDRALSAHRLLRQQAPGSRIAVNMSARSLLSLDLTQEVRGRLAAHHVPGTALTIEITEPSAHHSALTGRCLASLRHLGCRLSIHEFGTGQSSLASLSGDNAVQEIKIAPTLAGSVLLDPAAERVVRALAGMARGLDIEVVAEGVESPQLAHRLRDLGCGVLQGYYVQGPAPLAQTQAWLTTWPGLRPRRLELPTAPTGATEDHS